MKQFAALSLILLTTGCDLSSGNRVEDRMRADALSRASADCGAAASCRVSMTKNETDWVVTVSPSALGTMGDPQFNSGAVHHYHYDFAGAFVSETAD